MNSGLCTGAPGGKTRASKAQREEALQRDRELALALSREAHSRSTRRSSAAAELPPLSKSGERAGWPRKNDRSKDGGHVRGAYVRCLHCSLAERL